MADSLDEILAKINDPSVLDAKLRLAQQERLQDLGTAARKFDPNQNKGLALGLGIGALFRGVSNALANKDEDANWLQKAVVSPEDFDKKRMGTVLQEVAAAGTEPPANPAAAAEQSTVNMAATQAEQIQAQRDAQEDAELKGTMHYDLVQEYAKGADRNKAELAVINKYLSDPNVPARFKVKLVSLQRAAQEDLDNSRKQTAKVMVEMESLEREKRTHSPEGKLIEDYSYWQDKADNAKSPEAKRLAQSRADSFKATIAATGTKWTNVQRMADGSFIGTNPNTGKMETIPEGPGLADMTEAEAKQAEKDKRDARKDQIAYENSLRSDYIKEYGGSIEAVEAAEQAVALLSDPSGAADLASTFGFMKTLDPGSVVREGEFALVGTVGGVSEGVIKRINNAIRGEGMTPSIRKDLAQVIQIMADKHYTKLQEGTDRYTGMTSIDDVAVARPEAVVGDARWQERRDALGTIVNEAQFDVTRDIGTTGTSEVAGRKGGNTSEASGRKGRRELTPQEAAAAELARRRNQR